MSNYPQYIIERFWSYVDKTPNSDDHWLWTGARNSDGYGTFALPDKTAKRLQRSVGAHRFAYILEHTDLPSNVLVLHRPPCVTRHCVRHLYLGNQKDNSDDAHMLGRRNYEWMQGENRHHSKWTTLIILAIRQDFDAGLLNQREIAIKYNMNFKYVNDIVHRKCWRHL